MVVKQDEELLEAWLAREDRAALGELFGRHYPGVYQVALRIVHDETDARDVAQATFLKALRKAEDVRQKDRFRYWLLRIAVNEARQHHRRARPSVSLDDLAEVFAEARRATVPQEAGRREFELELERALETMPEPLKTPLVLHYYQSLSLAEVARVLELPKSTVQSRCERAVALLRTRFKRSGNAALVPLLAAHFPDLAVPGVSASATATAGALAMKSWILISVTLLLAAWLLLDTTGLLEPEPQGNPPTSAADGGVPPDDASGVGSTVPVLQADGAQARTRPAEDRAAAPRVASTGPGAVTGRVVALASGRGLGGALVRLAPSPTDENGWMRVGDEGYFENLYVTDADGRFVCDHLPVPGTYDLCVRRRGYGYAERLGVAVTPESGHRDLGVVLLLAGHTLAGRVVDADGRPVPGARVSAGSWRESASPQGFRLAGTPLRGASDRSAGDGRFELTGLSVGAHRLRVDCAGFATATRAAVALPRDDRIEIVLATSVPTRGLVVDEAGAPVAGARVAVSIAESRRRGSIGVMRQVPWSVLESDAKGGFELAGLPDGAGYGLVLEVSREGCEDKRLEQPVPDGGALTCVLSRRAVLAGVTVRLRPLPDAGALPRDARGHVTLQAEDGRREREARLSPDAGLFEIADVPPGRWHVRAAVAGFAPVETSIEVGGEGLDRTLRLARGKVLEGRVVDAVTGAGVAGATVRWVHSDVHVATSDEDGRYRLEGLSLDPGRTHIGAFTARAPDFLSRDVPVKGPQGDVATQDIALQPRSALRTVRGVVRGDGGAPVLGARVALQVNDGRGNWHATSTAPDGAFEIAGLDPSHLGPTVRLSVSHPRYAPLARRAPEAAEDAPLALTLERGRQVTGRVLDAGGEPVGGVTVGYLPGTLRTDGPAEDEYAVWSAHDALQRAAVTDARGRFVLERVPSRVGSILAFHAHARWLRGAEHASNTAIDAAGPARGLTLRLEMGRRVRGVLVDAEGRAVVGALVRAEGVIVGTRSDAQGRFDLTPVFHEGSQLLLTARHETGRARVQVPLDEADGVRLVLRATGTLTGRVLDAAGRPRAEALVTLRGEDGESLGGTRTDAEGSFRLEDVYAGAAQVEVRTVAGQELPLTTRSIEIKPGDVTQLEDLRLP